MFRQQRRIGVEYDVVRLIRNRRENFALGRGRILEQGERLVGMAGKHELVEAVPVAGCIADKHAVVAAAGTPTPPGEAPAGPPDGSRTGI